MGATVLVGIVTVDLAVGLGVEVGVSLGELVGFGGPVPSIQAASIIDSSITTNNIFPFILDQILSSALYSRHLQYRHLYIVHY